MIKGILVDFFGVVCAEIGWRWFDKYMSDTQENRAFLKGLFARMDRGDMTQEEMFFELARKTGRSAEEISVEMYGETVIDRGILNVIEALRRRYKIGLLSNSDAAMIRKILSENDLERYFDTFTISSEVGHLKPEREIFDRACASLGVERDEALFFDDRQEHVDAARSYGMEAVVFRSAPELESELRKLKVLDSSERIEENRETDFRNRKRMR